MTDSKDHDVSSPFGPTNKIIQVLRHNHGSMHIDALLAQMEEHSVSPTTVKKIVSRYTKKSGPFYRDDNGVVWIDEDGDRTWRSKNSKWTKRAMTPAQATPPGTRKRKATSRELPASDDLLPPPSSSAIEGVFVNKQGTLPFDQLDCALYPYCIVCGVTADEDAEDVVHCDGCGFAMHLACLSEDAATHAIHVFCDDACLNCSFPKPEIDATVQIYAGDHSDETFRHYMRRHNLSPFALLRLSDIKHVEKGSRFSFNVHMYCLDGGCSLVMNTKPDDEHEISAGNFFCVYAHHPFSIRVDTEYETCSLLVAVPPLPDSASGVHSDIFLHQLALKHAQKRLVNSIKCRAPAPSSQAQFEKLFDELRRMRHDVGGMRTDMSGMQADLSGMRTHSVPRKRPRGLFSDEAESITSNWKGELPSLAIGDSYLDPRDGYVLKLEYIVIQMRDELSRLANEVKLTKERDENSNISRKKQGRGSISDRAMDIVHAWESELPPADPMLGDDAKYIRNLECTVIRMADELQKNAKPRKDRVRSEFSDRAKRIVKTFESEMPKLACDQKLGDDAKYVLHLEYAAVKLTEELQSAQSLFKQRLRGDFSERAESIVKGLSSNLPPPANEALLDDDAQYVSALEYAAWSLNEKVSELEKKLGNANHMLNQKVLELKDAQEKMKASSEEIDSLRERVLSVQEELDKKKEDVEYIQESSRSLSDGRHGEDEGPVDTPH